MTSSQAYAQIMLPTYARYGAQMGFATVDERRTQTEKDQRVYDRAVYVDQSGYTHKGTRYFGCNDRNEQLRVQYTGDLKFIRFYRRK